MSILKPSLDSQIKQLIEGFHAIFGLHLRTFPSGFEWRKNFEFDLSTSILKVVIRMTEKVGNETFEFKGSYHIDINDGFVDLESASGQAMAMKHDFCLWFQEWLQNRLVPA